MVRCGAIRLGVVAFWLATAGPAAFGQQISYTVAIEDSAGTSADLYQPIIQHVQAAGGRWNNYLRPLTNVVLEVRVTITTDVALGSGQSTTTSFVETRNGLNVFEQGAAAEVRTGIDPNQAAPDIQLRFNPDYLRNTLWFDPDPTQRTAPVTATRTDAMSVFLHELAHAFAFDGWRDGISGELPGNYQSTFDRHVSKSGDFLFFNGPEAMAQYGGQPVPLTVTEPMGVRRYAHLGNNAPRPGADLVPDLMNGVVFTNGTRYDISLLDVAILADSGVPVVPVPEPVLGLGVAVVGLALFALRRSRDRKGAAGLL